MTAPKSNHLTWHANQVTPAQRAARYGQQGAVIWLTGLSGSGKSTVAMALEARLVEMGHMAYVLDGDNLRHGLNGDLGFSPTDRAENVRRVGEVARLFADAGIIALAAFISPYRAGRAALASRVGERFFEVHVATPLAACEARDPKGLYAKARRGEIKDFTGISAPYEAPESPRLAIDTSSQSLAECVDALIGMLRTAGVIPTG
jgi:adenylyl-sulfate kinase